MRYKAVFTDELLSYFRLDDNGKTIVLTDKQGFTRAVTLEVEVEPKRGKWETEVRTIRGHKIPFFACSVCGSNADDKYPYCPNCGAKMEMSEDGET